MKFYSQDSIVYDMRNELSSIQSMEELMFWYLKNEPHTLTSAGFLSKFIRKHNLNGLLTLNIGVDFFKESLLNRMNSLAITSFDIDEGFIDICTELNSRLMLNNQFIAGNLLDHPLEDFVNKKFKLGTLIQMDYNFNDEEFKSIIDVFYKNEIENLVLFTPSVHSFAKYDVISILDYVWDYYNSTKTWKFKNNAKKIMYRRTKNDLCDLISSKYKLADSERFRYPYGRIHMFKFDLVR